MKQKYLKLAVYIPKWQKQKQEQNLYAYNITNVNNSFPTKTDEYITFEVVKKPEHKTTLEQSLTSQQNLLEEC